MRSRSDPVPWGGAAEPDRLLDRRATPSQATVEIREAVGAQPVGTRHKRQRQRSGGLAGFVKHHFERVLHQAPDLRVFAEITQLDWRLVNQTFDSREHDLVQLDLSIEGSPDLVIDRGA